MNLTSIHKDSGSIPGLAQHAAGVALKKKKKKKKKITIHTYNTYLTAFLRITLQVEWMA